MHTNASVNDQEAVDAYLLRARITQKQLAQQARVSQSTVSRARSAEVRRQGRAHARLLTYIHEQSREDLHTALRQAIDRTWDRTPKHAQALARLIAASAELWPALGMAETDDHE
jgi:transcriptional regulator with XRE-family HTH domain